MSGKCNCFLECENRLSCVGTVTFTGGWRGGLATSFVRLAVVERMEILAGRNLRERGMMKHQNTQCHKAPHKSGYGHERTGTRVSLTYAGKRRP